MIAGSKAPAKPPEASELPRPSEAPQGPDGPQETADATRTFPKGTGGVTPSPHEVKEGSQESNARNWETRILEWKRKVAVNFYEYMHQTCFGSGDEEPGKRSMTKVTDDTKQLLKDIKELEKQIDEDASIVRLQERAELIEVRVHKVTARGADGPPTSTSAVGNPGKKSKNQPRQRLGG